MTGPRSPAPGAVIAYGPVPERLRELTRAPFRERFEPVRAFAEGPLAVAAAPAPQRGLSVGPRTVCLFEGALYDGLARARADTPADQVATALATAFEADGEACLAPLRGDFWTFVWDRSHRRGVVAADHLGGRGPYWIEQDGVLLCASEVPELLAAVPRRPAADPVALAHWLMLTLPAEGATLFAGLRRLQAGHVLELGAGRPRLRRYWEPVYREPLRLGREEAVERIRAALSTATRRRLTGAPAVLLSGGLDSSAVAAVAAEAAPGIATYSAVFPDHPAVDESALIDATTRRLRLPSTRIAVRGGSVLAGALDYLAAWSLPPTSPNLFFWTPLLTRAAADGVTVMLDGEGGDEVFGFAPYLLADRLRAGHVLSALRLAGRWPGWPGRPTPAEAAARLAQFGLRGALPAAAHLAVRRVRGVANYAPPWLGERLGAQWLASETSAFAFKSLDGPRWWTYLVDALTRGVGPAAVFEQARRRAEVAGLAARHPLVDVDLIELMLSLDPAFAFDRRFSRPLLREALSGRLDDEVRLRRGKSYFDAVFQDALAGADLPAVRALLHPDDAKLAGYVDMRALHRELLTIEPAEHPRGIGYWSLRVWRLLTAELWLRAQENPLLCEQMRGEINQPADALAVLEPLIP
jgi:asparagine synthase (glutamine-hydrolysing)